MFDFFYKNVTYTLWGTMQRKSRKEGKIKPLLMANNKRNSIFISKIEIGQS